MDPHKRGLMEPDPDADLDGALALKIVLWSVAAALAVILIAAH
jgi:hypothetical protein